MAQTLDIDIYDQFTGDQPSWEFTSEMVPQNTYSPTSYELGSEAGGTPPAGLVGQTPGSTQPDPTSYAARKQGQPASQQPLFWLVAMMALGVAGFGLVAHLETRGR